MTVYRSVGKRDMVSVCRTYGMIRLSLMARTILSADILHPSRGPQPAHSSNVCQMLKILLSNPPSIIDNASRSVGELISVFASEHRLPSSRVLSTPERGEHDNFPNRAQWRLLIILFAKCWFSDTKGVCMCQFLYPSRVSVAKTADLRLELLLGVAHSHPASR